MAESNLEETYTPCPNCDVRLIEVRQEISNPQSEYVGDKFLKLFRDIYIHCPGTSPKAFGRFINEMIVNYLKCYRVKGYILPRDEYKRNRILKSQGQLAELGKVLIEVETREELTFLMWEIEAVGSAPSDMDLYANYEALVYSRLDELREEPMPDTMKFILTKHGTFRTRRAEDCNQIAQLQDQVEQLEKANKQLLQYQEVGQRMEKEFYNRVFGDSQPNKVKIEELQQTAEIYEKAFHVLQSMCEKLMVVQLKYEELLVEHKANEAGLLELAAYIEEQNKIIASQKIVIDQVKGAIGELPSI